VRLRADVIQPLQRAIGTLTFIIIDGFRASQSIPSPAGSPRIPATQKSHTFPQKSPTSQQKRDHECQSRIDSFRVSQSIPASASVGITNIPTAQKSHVFAEKNPMHMYFCKRGLHSCKREIVKLIAALVL